jgi:hypothetical protein
MPIDVTWYDAEQSVLRWAYHGAWTWSEYNTARAQARQLTQDAARTHVDILADFRDSRLLPANALSNFRMSANDSDYQFSLAVIIAESLWMETMVSALNRLYPTLGKKVQLARTLEDGIKLIQAHRAKSAGR